LQRHSVALQPFTQHKKNTAHTHSKDGRRAEGHVCRQGAAARVAPLDRCGRSLDA
jgi:hypothetical protein